jgi:23S rRNA (pseudouridine1915-N3)-methyltransferase
MRLMIVTVGRLKSGPERELCERYSERIRATARAVGITDIRTIELAESKQRRPDDRKADEAAAIRAEVPEGAVLVLFDETGKALSSEQFAAFIAQSRAAAPPALVFVIGGADGLSQTLVQDCAASVSFGRMTLPHQLVRVLVLEQIYRAITILTGHPYHRA